MNDGSYYNIAMLEIPTLAYYYWSGGRTSPREFVIALRKALSATKIYSKETDSSTSL